MYGYRPNVRPYATARSFGHGDSARRQKSDEEDEENDKERSQAIKKRTQTQQGSVQPLRIENAQENTAEFGKAKQK